jgi:hypothetical protein
MAKHSKITTLINWKWAFYIIGATCMALTHTHTHKFRNALWNLRRLLLTSCWCYSWQVAGIADPGSPVVTFRVLQKTCQLTESSQDWDTFIVVEDSSLLGCEGVSAFSDVSIDRTAFVFIDQAVISHTKCSQNVKHLTVRALATYEAREGTHPKKLG